jgi:hypothetical protein
MRCLLLVICVAAAAAQPPRPAAPSAERIARSVQDRDTGRDSRAELRMKLFDRRGRARDRALTLLTLRRTEGDRSLIRFTYPNDIRGTGFLVWEHPAGDDERFLYLPSLGRVRRIAGSEAQESFVGSDFSYEDIGGREFDDYTYTLLDETASWTGTDGRSRPAYRLESKRKDASVQFPRVVSLVLKDSFVVVQADVHNRRNEKQKVYTVGRLEQVQGIWTVLASVMTNDLDRTRTELTIDKIAYNTGVTESAFSRRELEGAAK